MCATPKTFDGYEVSCRECNQCAATYKNTWVARCVAEKQTTEYAYAVTLTYADVDGVPPLGARVYRYSDVAKFWKRIRAAARYRWGENIDFRYVVVGEKGTKFGRCHYHAVVFSSHPIIELGDFSGPDGTGFEYKRRLNWSLWGHGFIEFQVADVAGMAYVLKYVLKSRMTAARSAGYAREGARNGWPAPICGAPSVQRLARDGCSTKLMIFIRAACVRRRFVCACRAAAIGISRASFKRIFV